MSRPDIFGLVKSHHFRLFCLWVYWPEKGGGVVAISHKRIEMEVAIF